MAATGDSGGEDLATFYVIANYRTPQATQFTKAGAALFVARSLGWPWKFAEGSSGVLPRARCWTGCTTSWPEIDMAYSAGMNTV